MFEKKPKVIHKHIHIAKEEIQSGDLQLLIEPLWWTVSIYDGEEVYNQDLSRFSLPQRYVFAIEWYTAEVNNGGHDQFYSNSTGIVWKDALEGFNAIGHQKAYEILKESVDRMGGNPSMDRDIRNDQLDNCTQDFDDLDDLFYEISDLEERIMAYILAHETEFYFDGEVEIPE